jgi:hypothetical protein
MDAGDVQAGITTAPGVGAVSAGLPSDTRPLPLVVVYDELLAKRSHTVGIVSKESIS